MTAGTVDAIRDAVGRVLDPELGLTLGELDMVRGVRTRRRGRVEVEVALTTKACPLQETIRLEVVDAVRTVDGHAVAEVVFTTMDEQSRRRAADVLLRHGGPRGARRASTIYAVASGKGGVGKSTVAANLAVALAAQGKSVGLLDADVWGYSVPQLFGVRRPPVAMYETMLPVQAHGVRLMSLGFLVEDETPIVWRGPMLHKALTQFVDDVHWGDLDVLLLDLPPGTGDVTLSVLELLPDASLVVVTTPQQAARSVAARVGLMARDVGMPIAGVVENMSSLVCGACGERTALFDEGGGAALADEVQSPLLGQVPLDVELRRAGDRGTPLVASAPHAQSAQALSAIARVMRPVRRSLLGRSLPLTPV